MTGKVNWKSESSAGGGGGRKKHAKLLLNVFLGFDRKWKSDEKKIEFTKLWKNMKKGNIVMYFVDFIGFSMAQNISVGTNNSIKNEQKSKWKFCCK